jgi:hypothetical protein
MDAQGTRGPIPSTERTCSGEFAAHWPIAVNDRQPAMTAHTASISTVVTRWRTPRRFRGSGTDASAEQTGADTMVVHGVGQVVNDTGESTMMTRQAWSLVTIKV